MCRNVFVIRDIIVIACPQILAGLHPDKFGWTVRHYDELFLVLNATVQQYYVRRFGEYTGTRSSNPVHLRTVAHTHAINIISTKYTVQYCCV